MFRWDVFAFRVILSNAHSMLSLPVLKFYEYKEPAACIETIFTMGQFHPIAIGVKLNCLEALGLSEEAFYIFKLSKL